jgi:AcrR family transcriptional regulator
MCHDVAANCLMPLYRWRVEQSVARRTLRAPSGEYRFIAVNLDSSRKRAAQAKLKSQLRETVRAQILDAAEELIAARGLHSAALAQIAKRAGVAVGTLYNYFADRDAMIRALFESRRAVLKPKLLAAASNAQALPFEPRLRQFVRDLLAAFEEHRRFVKVATETEHMKIQPTTTASDLVTAVETIVDAGVAERAIDSNKAPLLKLVIPGAIKGVIMRRTIDGAAFVDDADAIVSIILDGARRR